MIVFGREAAIEIPPLDEDQQMPRVETLVDREYTNLAGAMKLAQASFPHDAAKRIVIVTDGNQNIGDALEQARALAEAGIGIDVVPVRSQRAGEVAVEKVAIPADVRRGQPFDLRVVLNNTARPRARRAGRSKGGCKIVRKAGGREQVLAEQEITLEPGKRVFTVREEIDAARLLHLRSPLRARRSGRRHHAAEQSGHDLHARARQRPGAADRGLREPRRVRLSGRAAAGHEPGSHACAARRPEELFTDLAELQPFDTVILANVPREHFSDEQIEMLVRNTQQLGSGLVMLGGPNSFGAGGWTNTPIEEAMPVDFQIKNAKVVPVGALAMMMHASELPEGNYWQKVIAREALKALGDQDYCGVLHWSGDDEWLWRPGMLKVGGNREQMLARLDRMTPGDMPDFESVAEDGARRRSPSCPTRPSST